MTEQERSAKEPVLNSVARRLGYVAGTLAHAAHDFTGNLSAPKNKPAKKQQAGGIEADSPRRKSRGRSAARKPKTKTRTVAKKRTAGSGADSANRKRAAKR